MTERDKLINEIASLKKKIKSGVYTGEKYQLAVDMLKTKQDELESLTERTGAKSIIDAPIVGLVTNKRKTLSQMGGGIKML